MAATPIEIRSELTPDEFEPALERVPGVLQQGKATPRAIALVGVRRDQWRERRPSLPSGRCDDLDGVGRGTLYIIEHI